MTTASPAPARTAAPAGPPAVPRPVLVTVAVPTYRRHDRLRGMLPLVLDQARELATRSGGRHVARVLVIDNDPDGGAAVVVDEVAAPDLRYVVERTPGIAAVRNRALDECADADLLVFIDDDERPEPHWLARLLDAWAGSGAAAVAGRVHPEFAGELDPWVRAGGFFARRSLPSGTALDVAATSNLLLDLAQVRAFGVRFDQGLGLAGGEDNLFSRSLVRAGGRMVWCDESVVADLVPAERMTRSWVLARAWSHGNAAVLTELRLARRPVERGRLRALWTVRGAVRVGGGAARWCLGTLIRADRHRARGLRAVWRGCGIIAGAGGLVYREYARTGARLRFGRIGS